MKQTRSNSKAVCTQIVSGNSDYRIKGLEETEHSKQIWRVDQSARKKKETIKGAKVYK